MNWLEKLFKACSLLFLLFIPGLIAAELATPKVSPEESRLIQTCVEACKVFRSAFAVFRQDMTLANWNQAKQVFTTCQWRCYRCSLKTGVHGMEMIETVASDFTTSESKEMVEKYRHDIFMSGFVCREKWTISSLLGCTKDPVELVEPFCKNC